MVLQWDSGIWLESHSLTVSHKIVSLNWLLGHFSSLLLVEEYFHVFQNKNNLNWSVTISLMQFGKFWVNTLPVLTSGLALAKPPCTECWFHSLIFRLVVLTMHEKDEFAFPVTQTQKFIKESLIWTKHKKSRRKDVLYWFHWFQWKAFS